MAMVAKPGLRQLCPSLNSVLLTGGRNHSRGDLGIMRDVALAKPQTFITEDGKLKVAGRALALLEHLSVAFLNVHL